MISEITTVMQNTRPKYSSATAAARAITETLAEGRLPAGSEDNNTAIGNFEPNFYNEGNRASGQ